MQSTSLTNFSTVNALNKNAYCIQIKEQRGSDAKGTKRSWGIEMNDAGSLYLNTYGAVNSIDAQNTRCRIGYRCFKYWHSAKNHSVALEVVVVACDMYRECLLEAQVFFQLSSEEK
jgi:hypothetical protein